MPTQYDFSGSPYFDDYDETKNFHKILFKPSVSVQIRELNQLQTILQNQIERFGDNIYKQGTIIDGCNFSFHNNVPYVKIKDIETNGTRVIVDNYVDYHVKNSANLIGKIVEVGSGFESTTNKNTLFVNYLNSGNTLNTYAFSADDVLTIYNPEAPVERININDGSVGFSNNDDVIILSAITVTNTTGGVTFSNTFTAGDIITNTLVANAEIVEVDTTSNTASIILRIKPLSVDLVNADANTSMWTFTADDVFSADNGEAGIVSSVIGSSANATLVTTGVGTISTITVTDGGSGYITKPTVSIMSHTATTGQVDNLDLDADTNLAVVTVMPNSAVPVGSGYGVSVDQGIVYQKSHFIRVDPQFIIVSRYEEPDEIHVGFNTTEEIINSNIDTSLLDNVLGSPNAVAPGADRLKLTTTLTSMSKSEAEANTEFLSIIEFSGGQPYLQRKQTQYNVIDDEMSKRTYDQSGNFVLDQFLLNTKSEAEFADEANTFVAVIDPGTAYINGKRVVTDSNFNLSIDKGTDTQSGVSSISMDYGSYIKIKNVGGMFKFNTAAQVALYDGAYSYFSAHAGAEPAAPSSNLIGYARIRSLTHESGIPGTSSAVYRLYVFDIQMSSGKNFSNVRSIFYDGTYNAVGDVVTTTDPLSGATVCKLYDSNQSALVFNNGVTATKSISDETYVYRTVDHTLTANQSGYIVFNTGVSDTFPYSAGRLTTSQEHDVIVTPLANGTASANLGGSVALYSVNTSMVGTSTTFLTDLVAGDWVKVANATTNVIVQISSVANNTYATVTANASVNISSNGILYFPQFAPISLDPSARWANVSATANQMTVYVGTALDADLSVAVAYNVKTVASQVDKTVQRDKYVRIVASNNEANTVGPWAVGVPDVFRLKKVYVANGASNVLSINAVADVNSAADFVNYSNHRFANGDSVVYVGGTYNIDGLSNNTTYYIYGSNTSGFQLSSDNTTPLAINASATNDVSHTFTGSPLYFGANTYGVEDITNDFYIDHNQNENFYNTSYLYSVPSPNYTLSNNDVLLVKFDAFTHAADAGLKHIESYNIDDTVTLENSNSTINTLEIPQMYSVQDVYYDLRDSIDVRPHVVSTANLSANSLTTYTINPTEPVANAKFSATDKKFPAPESSFTANMEYYVGRVDRVIVDKNARITSIRGQAGTDKITPEPVNSLTINVLKIPPYPSAPLSLSEETIKFADTKIANEKYLFRRLSDFRVKTSFTSVDIREEQPKAYNMAQIGALERRIENVEYYVALTMAETTMKNRVIPSSVDASLDRFKYGFFVDPFDSPIYSDIDNTEYNASVVDGDLVPNFGEINLEFKFNTANSAVSSLVRGGKFISPAYQEYTLINQSVATDGSVTTSNTVTSTTQKLVSVDIINRTTNYSLSGAVYEDWTFTFSNTAYSPVELFMNCTDNDTAVVVYQTTSSTFQNPTITTSSQYATPNLKDTAYVRQGGKAYLVGGRTRWENDTGFRSGGPSAAGSLWIEDSYRMSWNHDPSKGRYYIIRVYKGSHIVSPDHDRPIGTYAFRLWYPVDSDTNVTSTVITQNNFRYEGTCILSSIRHHVLASSYTTKPFHDKAGHPVTNFLGFEYEIHGLRPNTHHKIYVDRDDFTDYTILRNVNGSSDITPWLSNFPTSLGAGYIASDGYGKISGITFKPYLAVNSNLQNINQYINNLMATTVINVVSSDVAPATIKADITNLAARAGSSSAVGSAAPKAYGPNSYQMKQRELRAAQQKQDDFYRSIGNITNPITGKSLV